MLIEQSGTRQEVLSPLHHHNEANNTTQTSPYCVGNIYPSFGEYIAMAFSYPRFSGETNVEDHARSFLNVWNVNHVSQWLPEAEAHASKVPEFGLTLD